MTDLLEPSVDVPPEHPDHRPPPGPSDSVPVAPLLRWVLAACLFGAGAIHLAMVPAHMAEWAPEGTAFVITAWIQIGLGTALLLSSRRWVLWCALLGSAAFLGAWGWTRVWGPPFGPGSGVAEPASFVDLTCAVLEGMAVVVAALALWRPQLTAHWERSALVLASIVPVAVLVGGSIAVASPSASEHAHGHGATEAGHDHGATGAPDGLGFSLLSNGHHHEIAWHDLDPVTQAELDRQLDLTRQVALAYPTVASAEAAGYTKAGPYSPGLGAHYTKAGLEELNPSGTMTDDALRHPLSVIYDGNDPSSQLVGFMYYSVSAVEPTGFVGTNDVWHTHSNLCLRFTPDGVESPYGADLEATREQCDAVGGTLVPSTQWMIHVWTVPGYDNVDGGPFAELNPKVACSDGTYFRLPADEWAQNLTNVCRSKAPGEPLPTGV